jgi:hypothetical protein
VCLYSLAYVVASEGRCREYARVRTLITIVLIAFIGPVAAGAEENLLHNLRKDHPRLLVLDDDLAAVRKHIETHPLAKEWFALLHKSAEKLLDEPPTERTFVGKRMLSASRQVLNRVATLAGIYRITGDKRFARRAADELLAVAKFQDWNPPHFLDTAEMTNAFGMGYDWLYSVLSEEERSVIRTAIIDKGLKPALELYAAKRGFATVTNNWSQVCNGGLTVGALAIADEAPEIANRILEGTRETLPKAMAAYGPDGGFIEGPSYWCYSTRYVAFYLAALHTALGTDFDFLKTPGLADTGNFRMHTIGPLMSTFNYADAGDGIAEASSMFWLARTFNRPVYAAHERMTAQRGKQVDPFHLMWFNGDGADDDVRALATSVRFTAVDVALMRSAWNDPRAAFIGFKGGSNGASHAHLDLGSFIYDVDGIRWAIDLGPDDYNLLAYFGNKRWEYYRLRTEGHNTLVIDGKNQLPKARAPLTDFVHDGKMTVAIVDLSDAYDAPVTSVRRRMELLDRTMLITDTVESAHPVDVVWNLHTQADIKITEDGMTAMLSQAGNRVRAKVHFPKDARFETVSANPPPPQRQQPDVKNLIIRQPAKVKDLRLQVTLMPQ